jgi:hypothetical protein
MILHCYKTIPCTVLLALAAVLVPISNVSACDPLGCLFSGHKQDALIIAEVTSVDDGSGTPVAILPPDKELYVVYVNILEIFSQNTSKVMSIGEDISIFELTQSSALSAADMQSIQAGKKYLMSLREIDGEYLQEYGVDEGFLVPAWGLYEVTGNNHMDMRLVHVTSIEDEALQHFITSGGKDTNFAFDYSGDVPVLTHNGVPVHMEKTNILPLYLLSAGVMCSILYVAYTHTKRKSNMYC